MITVITYKPFIKGWLDLEEVKATTNPEEVEGLVVAWGRSVDIPGILNKPEAVSLAADKAASRVLLQEAGIPVPIPSEDQFPVVGRPAKHSKGRKFFICLSPQDVVWAKENGAVYFSKVFFKTAEFRVHVAAGQVLCVAEKTPPRRGIIWNKENGSEFRIVPWSKWNREVMEVAIRAIQALGLDFGAADVMADDKEVMVSEVNTAPGLCNYTRGCYLLWFRAVERGLNIEPAPDKNLLKRLRKEDIK